MWGTNAKDEKILIAIGLRAADNMVDIYTFPFDATSEEFYNLMLNEWRESHEVSFPEVFTHIERPLTASETILPDDIRVDRSDVIQRAQTEWHFVVLSHKLYESFRLELEEVREKVEKASKYSNTLWEEMKTTWEKIQKHIFDKTLLRDHSQQLRDMTNDLFTALKNMRKELDSEVDRISRENVDEFTRRLNEIEEKIKSGMGLQPLFNDLKQLQREFKDARLSRNDRGRLWKRIDHAFKAVKEKRFGEKGSKESNTLDRLNRRYQGLLSAIDKMQKSIKRDAKDKSFEDDRIANSDGQLEAQIRMAKLKMINERIDSKNEKLNEMLKTKGELEERIEREKKFVDQQKQQQAIREDIKEAKETVKQKIAEEIQAQSEHMDEDALKKAAEQIAEDQTAKKKGKKRKASGDSMFDAISETLGESLEDLGDSIGAVASVVADKIGESLKELKEEAKEFADETKEEIEETVSEIKEKMKRKQEE